jgi:murein tripeptide amidase MpaA
VEFKAPEEWDMFRGPEGRDLYRVTITDPQGDVPMSRRWVHLDAANQHPDEGVAQWHIARMAKWFLSDEAVETHARTIAHFTFMMNSDGVARGWCRVNVQGIDMNRSLRSKISDPKL